MKRIMKHESGVRFFPFCPKYTLEFHEGWIAIPSSDGREYCVNYYCEINKNPYIGMGTWYVHHKKPAFLVKHRDMFCMGTVEELADLMDNYEEPYTLTKGDRIASYSK